MNGGLLGYGDKSSSVRKDNRGFAGDFKLSEHRAGETLSQRMGRLRVELKLDFRVVITTIVLDTERWNSMSDEEKKIARNAKKKLSGGNISPGRRRELKRMSVPTKEQPIIYPDAGSALRAVKEHIPENKRKGAEKLLVLLGVLEGINQRIAEANVGEMELSAKLGQLSSAIDALKKRNVVWLVDHQADLAQRYIGEAVDCLARGKRTIACTKLVAARNVLSEKLEHNENRVLRRAAERTQLLETIIKLQGTQNGLSEIVEQLRTSASIKEKLVEKLTLALLIIDSRFTVELEKRSDGEPPKYAGPDELARLFVNSKVKELATAGNLLAEAERFITSSRSDGLIRQAREKISEVLGRMNAFGPMKMAQKARISNILLETTSLFESTNEKPLMDAAELLFRMHNFVMMGKPKEALDIFGGIYNNGDGVPKLLNQMDWLFGKTG